MDIQVKNYLMKSKILCRRRLRTIIGWPVHMIATGCGWILRNVRATSVNIPILSVTNRLVVTVREVRTTAVVAQFQLRCRAMVVLRPYSRQ